MITISDYIEFSPFDNKISEEFLKYYPDNLSEPNKTIDKEEEFWNRFFVEYPECQYNNTISSLRDSIDNSNKHFILFIGTSGSGKTTFLHYLIKKKNDLLDKALSIDMVNLIRDATSADARVNIINTIIDDKIENYLEKKDVVEKFIRFISAHDKVNPVWDARLFNDRCGDEVMFYNFIGSCKRNYTKSRIKNFCGRTTNISDKIALYVISYIFHECLEERKPCVFVFDNLDELDQTYLAKTLVDDFLTAFSKAQDFFNKYVKPSEDYNFVSKCTFINSIRNNHVASINACQFLDRADARSTTIKFDSGYQSNLYNIFERRMRLFQNYQKSLGMESLTSWANGYNIEIISREKNYIETDLCCLFNLDYRVTLSSLEEALREDMVSWGTIASKDEDCSLGIRGFFLFHVLKHQLKISSSHFARYIDDELKQNGCNINRMLFSLLSNMCEDDGVYSINKKKHSDILHVSLLEFTNRVLFWYKDISIKSMYETLFVSGNHNYSLPASLVGDRINNYLLEKRYEVSLQNLSDYVADLYKKDKEELSNVDIVVNPVCAAYSKRVFIHFEYFNMLSIVNERSAELLYGAKSLFQQDTQDQIVSCIERVYKMTKWVVEKADNHVCEMCEKKCDITKKKGDCRSVIVHLNNNGFLMQKNILYTSRLITSHINYLDSFRKFLWNKYHENNLSRNSTLQKYIIDIIEKYVLLFRNKKVKNNAIDAAITDIEKNLSFAKNKGYKEWTPITIGLDPKTMHVDQIF